MWLKDSFCRFRHKIGVVFEETCYERENGLTKWFHLSNVAISSKKTSKNILPVKNPDPFPVASSIASFFEV